MRGQTRERGDDLRAGLPEFRGAGFRQATPHHREAGAVREDAVLLEADAPLILRAMPKPQHFHGMRRFVHAIEDQIRCLHQFPHAGAAAHRAATVRKLGEAFGLIEQTVPQPPRRLRVMPGDVADDSFKIGQREPAEDYFEIH